MFSVGLADIYLVGTRVLGLSSNTTESQTAHASGTRTQAPHRDSGHPFHGCSSRIGAVVL